MPSIPNRTLVLQPERIITTAATFVGEIQKLPAVLASLTVQATFVRGSGGTTCKVFLQTTLDNEDSWIDIAQLAFTTASAVKVSALRTSIALAAATVPGDGALGDDSIVDGLFGDRVRIKVISTGTYGTSTTIKVEALPI